MVVCSVCVFSCGPTHTQSCWARAMRSVDVGALSAERGGLSFRVRVLGDRSTATTLNQGVPARSRGAAVCLCGER
jgi:hypothetical protein